MAMSVTWHEVFNICSRSARDSNPTEMHMSRGRVWKAFVQDQNKNVLFLDFDSDAAQNHGSLVINTAIVRKSHLSCFVNSNLTFVLVKPEEK